MEKRKGSKSRIFLAELMIDVLFFTIAAAICLTIFAKAYTMSRESREKNQALIAAQQGAESFKAGGEEGLVKTLGAVKEEDGSYAVYYDAKWNPAAGPGEAAYILRVRVEREDGMATAEVSVNSKESKTKEGQAKESQVLGIEVKRYEG